MNNTKQMMLAWQMYNGDNEDKIVMSFHGAQAQGGMAANNAKNSPWVEGWLDWTTSPDNTNVLFLIDEKYSKLAKYFGNSKNLLKCTADHYLSPAQRNKHWTERVRSVSGNIGIGDGNAEEGPFDLIYRHIRKTGDFAFAGPSAAGRPLRRTPDSINDAGLFNPRANGWIDQPASYHNEPLGLKRTAIRKSTSGKGRSLKRKRKIKLNDTVDAPAKPGDAISTG